jgi:hypothetical protein
MSDNELDKKQVAAGRNGGRRAYEPPRILSREPLEVVAAICTGYNSKAAAPQCGTLGGVLTS